MTSHINIGMSEKFSEPFGQPIGFDAILPVTHLEHDTVDKLVVCILLCVWWECEDRSELFVFPFQPSPFRMI